MATLYRKYRPDYFKEVVNQNHIKITIEHQIQSDKAAHAYLFTGPRAVGKTTLARVFAKALNCENRKKSEAEPCGQCGSCSAIKAGKNLDLIEIDAASHTGVDHVRESIIASARVVPSSSKYKIFIIDEVHMLSLSAFNALLKVLEEPPAYVVFILCTTEVHKVPTTIISRTQRFDFKRISVNDIVKKLQYIVKTEGVKVDKSILEAIARQSGGHMRDAESILGQVIAVGGKEITREEADLVIPRSDIGEVIGLLEALAKKDAAGGVRLVNRILDEGINLRQFTDDLIEILRKIMLGKLNQALLDKLSLELGETLELKIGAVSQDLNLDQIIAFIDAFMIARNHLKNSFIAQLPLELAITRLCQDNPGMRVKPEITGAKPGNPANFIPKPDNPTPAVSKTISISEGQVGDIDIETIIKKWHEVLAKVKQHNHSLSFILRVCEPRSVDGNKLCMAFKYKFHKNRIGDRQVKDLVEKVIREVYGKPLLVEAVIDESIQIPENGAKNVNAAGNNAKSDEMLDGLLKTFGGKVVE